MKISGVALERNVAFIYFLARYLSWMSSKRLTFIWLIKVILKNQGLEKKNSPNDFANYIDYFIIHVWL